MGTMEQQDYLLEQLFACSEELERLHEQMCAEGRSPEAMTAEERRQLQDIQHRVETYDLQLDEFRKEQRTAELSSARRLRGMRI